MPIRPPANRDRLTPARRSWNMSRIRSKDTTPEKRVRSMLHRFGLRFRLHVKKLPGKPDIVLTRLRTAVFVHGCFWHQHPNCSNATMPTHRREYWFAKLSGNVTRDQRHLRELKKLGWRTIVVWECETQRASKLERRLKRLFRV